MMWSVTLCILYVTLSVSTVKLKVDQAMIKALIVPDVIPVPPKQKLKVQFPNMKTLELGNELTPAQVKEQPFVKWDFRNKTTYYTLCMVDPDVPSRSKPTSREWQHWLVGNIPGSDINKGVSLSDYIGSGPPMHTGYHRYVYLVYKQPKMLNFDEPHLTNRSSDQRAKFSIAKFAKKYNLKNPVSGNFYIAKYDNYVPVLQKRLGGKLYVTLSVSTVRLKVDKAMMKAQIVPDVIPFPPKQKLKVQFPNMKTLQLGNELTPAQVKEQPWVKWDFRNKTTYYTLCMVDPDAPSRRNPIYREWQHWLVGNIPGSDINKGVSLSDYIGSGPPMHTGYHRYVYLVYKQPKMLTFDERHLTNRSSDHRAKFSIAKFAKKYNLKNPVAGNFYIAKYDNYVPILQKQLGG